LSADGAVAAVVGDGSVQAIDASRRRVLHPLHGLAFWQMMLVAQTGLA